MNNAWLSIDCDFFFDTPNDTSRAPDKRWSLAPEALLQRLSSRPAGVDLGIDHSELLARWDARGARSVRCVNLDAHHDLFADFNRGWEIPLGVRSARVGVGDHLFHALREGVVEALTWVLPPWLTVGEARREVRDLIGATLSGAVECVPFDAWSAPDLTDAQCFMCLSPEWTPRGAIEAFANLSRALGAEAPLVTRWLRDAATRYDALERGVDPLSLRFAFAAKEECLT
jgi:hypothetical protein